MGTTRTSWISEYLHTFPYLMHDHDPHLCARWWYSRHRPGTSSPPPLAVATPSAPICHPTAETRRIQLAPGPSFDDHFDLINHDHLHHTCIIVLSDTPIYWLSHCLAIISRGHVVRDDTVVGRGWRGVRYPSRRAHQAVSVVLAELTSPFRHFRTDSPSRKCDEVPMECSRADLR